MTEYSLDALYDTGACARCPLANKPGVLARLLGIRPKEAAFTYCNNRGPEPIVTGGAVETDYVSGEVRIEKDIEQICPRYLTREQRLSSTATEALIYDRFEEAHTELEHRDAHPDEVSVLDSMTLLDRRHIPAVKDFS